MIQEIDEPTKIDNARQFNELALIFIEKHGNINMLFVIIILSRFDVVVFGGVLRDFFAKIPSKDIDLAYEQINYIKDTRDHDLQNEFTALCALYGFDISDFKTVETVESYHEVPSELIRVPDKHLRKFSELNSLIDENYIRFFSETTPLRHQISFVLHVGEQQHDIIVDCNRISNTVESLCANTHPDTVGNSLYLVKDVKLKEHIFDSSKTGEEKYNIIYDVIANSVKLFIQGKDETVMEPLKIIQDLEKKIYAINNLISKKRIVKFFKLLLSEKWTIKTDFSDYQPVFLRKQLLLEYIRLNWPETLGKENDKNAVVFPSFDEITKSMSDEYVKIKEFILFLETPRVFEQIKNTSKDKDKILERLTESPVVIGSWVGQPLPIENETI
jgi:hypothetical protein